MKNFGTLLGYEMKKIWMRPLTLAAVLLFSLVFVFTTVRPFFAGGGATFTGTDAGGGEIIRYLTGGEQYRLRVEGARALSGRPMDEAFFHTARETIPMTSWFDRDSYFYLTDPSYADFSAEFGDWLDGTAEHYYAVRQSNVEQGWQRLGLTGEETAYWRYSAAGKG